MASRRPGSGLSSFTAATVEELLAAALCKDERAILAQQRALGPEYSLERCGILPAEIVRLVRTAVNELELEVAHAVAQPDDRLGDVRAVLKTGEKLWFEVKAQTKKERFVDLTQADWVRDETDFVRWLMTENPSIMDALPVEMQLALRVGEAADYFQDWDRDSLWLADMALLADRDVRERAGVYSPADLPDFLSRKYVLHLTQQGIRIIRLDAIAPITAALAGAAADMQLNYSNQTVVSVVFACPGSASRGNVHFTYHIGYPSGVLGRHKMHALSLSGARPRIEIPSKQ